MARKIDLDFYSEEICKANQMPRGKTQGYEVGALGVFLSPVLKLWRVCFILSMEPAFRSWPLYEDGLKGWAMKRQALAFAEELQRHGLNFMVKDAKEFQDKNSVELMKAAYDAAIEKAKEA